MLHYSHPLSAYGLSWVPASAGTAVSTNIAGSMRLTRNTSERIQLDHRAPGKTKLVIA